MLPTARATDYKNGGWHNTETRDDLTTVISGQNRRLQKRQKEKGGIGI